MHCLSAVEVNSLSVYCLSHESLHLNILWSKKFRILRRKCAPVGRIKSFTVTSGLRILKFRTVCPNEFFLDFGRPCQFQKSASKKIFKRHSSANGAKKNFETKLSWLVLTHHFVYWPKNFFSNNFKIWPKILLSATFLKSWNF